jgi:Leucine-rich repeat (LRR) protein
VKEVLFMHSQSLLADDVDKVIAELQRHPHAHTLVLSNNELGDAGVERLVNYLRDAHLISELRLAANQLTDQACQSLARLPGLKRLDLSANEITDKGLMWLTQ